MPAAIGSPDPQTLAPSAFSPHDPDLPPLDYASKFLESFGSRASNSVMVCSKCQKLQKTTLATPGVKRKHDMYYGSPTAGGTNKSKTSATQGSTGIGKVSVPNFHVKVTACGGYLADVSFIIE